MFIWLFRPTQHLPTGSRVVRVMPNTPALVQCAASVFTLGLHASRDDADLVAKMLSSVGLIEEMPEQNMDAVTGLSGNGPAYVSSVMLGPSSNLIKSSLDMSTRTVATKSIEIYNNIMLDRLNVIVCLAFLISYRLFGIFQTCQQHLHDILEFDQSVY